MSTPVSIDLKDCQKALEAVGVPPAEALLRYMKLLLEWNEKINLTGARNVDELALKHVVDVWSALNVLGGPTERVVDVGSGGGIPGIILAIMSPLTDVVLVERRQKKAGVLSQIIKELDLEKRVRVFSKSFEEVKGLHKDAEYWFRGFLPGPKFAVYLSEFFPHADLGQLVLMKGPAWPQEKLEIMSQPKVKRAWKERFGSAAELNYSLPADAGERLLVVV